jgi:class 3 adenylate cyclase
MVDDVSVERGEIRASDAERQAVIDRLSAACADGQLTLDEFSDRSGEAWAAVTRSQLEEVTRDLRLPVQSGAPAAHAEETAAPKPRRRWLVAIMGGENRRGRWRADRRLGAIAMMGGVNIDLRDATLEGDEIEITAWAVMGGVNIVVPEGIPVDFSGLMFMGGRVDRTSDVEPLPGAPTIRIRGYGMWGSIVVLSKPPRKPGEPDDDWSSFVPGTMPGASAHSTPQSTPHAHMHRYTQGHLPHWLPTPPPPPMPRLPHEWNGPDSSAAEPSEREPAPAAEPSGLVTVVCTDIVGSTRIADELGDQRWRTVLQAHYALARAELAIHGGTEVKTRGDGMLLTFTSPRRAVQFAVAFQTALDKQRVDDPELAMQARVGVHAGEVERDGDDVVGRNVSLACRLCDAAAPGEILASSVVADLTDSASDLSFGPPRELMLAGIERPVYARPATPRD